MWQHATNRKWYAAYLVAAIAMTLRELEGHSSIASLFEQDGSNIVHIISVFCLSANSAFVIDRWAKWISAPLAMLIESDALKICHKSSLIRQSYHFAADFDRVLLQLVDILNNVEILSGL